MEAEWEAAEREAALEVEATVAAQAVAQAVAVAASKAEAMVVMQAGAKVADARERTRYGRCWHSS